MAALETGELSGAVAVVSGGLGDIGRATAHALLAAGARVAISDLAPRTAGQAALPQAHYSRVDVTRPTEIKQWLRNVERTLGLPSLIICNAGIVRPAAALSATHRDWRRTMAVNLDGAYFLAQYGARRLVRLRRPGRIVFVGSWVAEIPDPRIAAYCVAKAGLRAAMKCLALELAPHGILVNEIAPGKLDAGLSAEIFRQQPGLRARARRGIPLRELIDASEVARAIVDLCQPRLRHMTGSVVLMDGGLSLVPPR